MPRKKGHRDRAALGEPLETAKDPNVSRETSVLKHQIVSRETIERIRMPRGEGGRTGSRRPRGLRRFCASVVRWVRGRGSARARARARRDALRLRRGRAAVRVGQLRGKWAACAGRSCERDALRCGCAEPAFTPPGTPGARASDGPLRRSPARRARTACRRRAPCCLR